MRRRLRVKFLAVGVRMASFNDADSDKDLTRITTMISDLRSAWIDLLSARCATDRLRARYSVQEMARFGERATLQKAVDAATAMCEYFTELRKQISSQN